MSHIRRRFIILSLTNDYDSNKIISFWKENGFVHCWEKNTYRAAISLSLDLKIIRYTLHILEQKSYHCISSVTKKIMICNIWYKSDLKQDC